MPILDGGAGRHARLLGLCALLAGALAGLGLLATPASMRADRALVLTGLLAVPAPLLVLLWLPSPPGAPLRRALGETTAARLAATRRLLLRGLLAMLGLPFGAGLVALWRPEAAADLQRFALCTLLGGAGGWLGATATCGWALASIGASRTDRFEKLAGGGVYGPALVAPMIYAPAVGYVLGMMPVGLLVAVWGGLKEPPSWSVLAQGATPALAAFAWLAHRSLAGLEPHVGRAWLRMEEALATPFAYDRSRPEPPSWLVGSAALPRMLGRAWVRRHPLPIAAPVVQALLLGALLPAGSGSAAFALVGVAVGVVAATRGASLTAHEPALAAAAALAGATSGTFAAAQQRLDAGLTAPALLGAAVLAWQGSWWAGPAGVALGVTAGVLLRRGADAAATLRFARAGAASAVLLAWVLATAWGQGGA